MSQRKRKHPPRQVGHRRITVDFVAVTCVGGNGDSVARIAASWTCHDRAGRHQTSAIGISRLDRRELADKVPGRLHLASGRAGHRGVIQGDRGALGSIGDSRIHHVIGVLGRPYIAIQIVRRFVPESLRRGSRGAPRQSDAPVKMPRASHIQTRLDGAESKLAG